MTIMLRLLRRWLFPVAAIVVPIWLFTGPVNGAVALAGAITGAALYEVTPYGRRKRNAPR